ncbi:protein of unknown function [Nitrospira japonica]|uniref:Uncharacterized protein n=1 Tax=Nitrospira japonica TaxID=1325564 RepID=A0A1W1IB73_9BACT|nr:protein of unknown function [Nitrospira japonica]
MDADSTTMPGPARWSASVSELPGAGDSLMCEEAFEEPYNIMPMLDNRMISVNLRKRY